MKTTLDELREEYIKFNDNIKNYNIKRMTRFINESANYKLYNLVNEIHENNLDVNFDFYKYCEDTYDSYIYELEHKFNVNYDDTYKQIGTTSSFKLDNTTAFYVNKDNKVLVCDDFVYNREIIDDYTLPEYVQEVEKMINVIETYSQSTDVDDEIENDIDMLMHSLDYFNDSLIQLEKLYLIHKFTLESIEYADSFETYKEYYENYLFVEESKQADMER